MLTIMNKKRLVFNEGAADTKGLIAILIIVILLSLVLIFKNEIKEFLSYLLSLIKKIIPS